MKSTYRLAITVSLIVVALCSPVLCQVDILKGQDERGDLRIGLFTHDADGSQNSVREFDGRTFDVWGIESLDSYGYSGDTQYWLSARDLILQDEDIDFSLAQKNQLSLNLSTSSLIHRFARVPAINPFLDEVSGGSVTFRDNGAPITVGRNGDTFLDLSPGIDFKMRRRVNSFQLGLTPCPKQRGRLILGWWEELEGGNRQLLFRARADAPLAGILNRQRGGAEIPINRSTKEGSLGTDLQVGKTSALNYRYLNTEFTDSGTRPTDAVLSSITPLKTFTRFSSKTTSNVFKARSRITDRLFFTGVHTERNRANVTANLPASHSLTAGAPTGTVDSSLLGSKVEVNSTNLAVSYLATNTLTLTGRWRKFDQDNQVPPVFSISSSGVVADTPDNQALSREVTSLDLSGTYTGIRKAYVKLGFEHRQTDRRLNPIHPPHAGGEDEEFEHPFTHQPTKSDIWRLGVRYYPTVKLSLNGNLEKWDTENPGYIGLPTDRTKTNINATYMVRNNFALYGDFVRSDDENKDVSILFADIPTSPPAVSDAAYRALRELAAGQGFDNEFTTTDIGAWYAVNPKLTLDVNMGKSSIDTSTLWIMGTSATAATSTAGPRPNLEPAITPFEADNNQWSLGANYALAPRWRVNGRFTSSNSEGKTLLDPSIFPGTLSTWTPVDVDSNRWTVGFAYDITAKDRLLLNFSVLDWSDNIDASQDGRFNIWRLAWSSSF